jgi:uncharacterized OsmC-like protein
MAELTVSYKRKGEIHNIQTCSPVMGELTIDQTDVPEDQRGGTAKQLLASSALYCFCSTLAKALETRGAVFSSIEGKATLETGLDDKKRTRVTKISIDVTVFMDEENEFVFERVEKIMQQGCLVTASLEKAFPVTYALHHKFE